MTVQEQQSKPRQCCANPPAYEITYDNGKLAPQFGFTETETILVCQEHYQHEGFRVHIIAMKPIQGVKAN